MENLPKELLEVIMYNLEIIDIIHFSQTCKKFYKCKDNKNIINYFSHDPIFIKEKEIDIGFIKKALQSEAHTKILLKKNIMYNCLYCGNFSSNKNDLLICCDNCKKYLCKKNCYNWVKFTNHIMNIYAINTCYNCIDKNAFISKTKNLYMIEFSLPHNCKQDEWYKKMQ